MSENISLKKSSKKEKKQHRLSKDFFKVTHERSGDTAAADKQSKEKPNRIEIVG
jgi:hypothetical protein